MRPRVAFCVAFLLCASFGANPVHALDPSGTAVAVVQAANASGPGGARTLGEKNPVYSGDRIATGGVGRAQILFRDDTRLVVAPNSSVVIDRFVYAGDSTAGGATVQFAKGAFRFISGSAPSGSYSINTPTATIGIRGTEFDVSVGGDGTAVLVFDGAVRVCNKASGRCAEVNRACGAIIASPDGGLHQPGMTAERASLIRASFPMAEAGGQGMLRQDFRVNTSSCRSTRNAATRNEQPAFTRLSAPAPAPEPPKTCTYKHKKRKHRHHHDDEGQSARSGPSGENGPSGQTASAKGGKKGGYSRRGDDDSARSDGQRGRGKGKGKGRRGKGRG